MSDIVYLMVSGQQQGAISDGCGTVASVGNRWQSGHEDEIFAFSLSNSITSTGRGSHFHGLQFCKLIDKSTPLFVNAINNNEQLYMEFYFYRINRFGRWEKYYYIQLRGAFLSAIQHQFSENNLDTETITINYEYIFCKHLIANTEFSYLALPENYNRLFIPPPKTPADNGLKTLNSKGVGRLLAAGGIYNGNIDGFRETAEKLGGDAPAGYEQVMNNKGLLILGASVAAGLTMGRMKFPELEELEQFGAKGTYTSRPFDPDKAGGPVEHLTTEGVNITHEGIAIVEKHISRFDPDPGNEFMVSRLKKIANGELLPEQVDLNYYTHECREYQRYCNLGWETGRPSDNQEAYDLWNNTHTSTLEDYRITGNDLYHPDAPSW
ncbi:type VI secretion system tube protein Hcp [Citrobacter europaeus]|uniref:type VI secretion system tube protein TssD n=1 Tax=Citrobacter europaeus TaxID=1914243 RepID=UPI000536858A|nr:type VI secretion system tube protein TssD [Citrobacter europaeus]AUT95113.1 type VI secretion system tube protein Hcp [Citrobacter freundii]ROW35266.1 type VI secretion system tube protein Hcp [Citrobacter europaeus]